jgi:hypothetical protein
MTGPTILHGPHQAAQKSTTTGLSDFNTTSSKVASVIANAIFYVFRLLILNYKDKERFYLFITSKLVFIIWAYNKLIVNLI